MGVHARALLPKGAPSSWRFVSLDVPPRDGDWRSPPRYVLDLRQRLQLVEPA
jgi:hypothetical protein